MEITRPRIYIEVIESLRGIAALGVMLIHFATSTLPTIKPNPLGDFFQWAHLGIPTFFIISGFIIPYAMYSGGYTLKKAGIFFAKRMLRMIPPAWAAILLMIIVYYGAWALSGSPIQGRVWPGLDAESIIGNLLLSFQLLGVEKYIDLFWTLEVEFQYYIVIMFLFPLVMSVVNNLKALTLVLLLVNATYFLNFDGRFMFFRDNGYFIIGMLLFLYKMKLIPRNYFIYSSLFFITMCYVQHNMYALTASITCVLIINYVKFSNPITDFLGKISYSLYITHHISGVVAEYFLRNLTGYEPSDPVKVIMLIVYGLISIFCAWLFFKVVEEPSLRLSKKLFLSKPKEKILKSFGT